MSDQLGVLTRERHVRLLNCSVSGCLLETNCRFPVGVIASIRVTIEGRELTGRCADREVSADRRRRRYLPRGCTVFVDAAPRPAVAAKRAPCSARRIGRDNRFLRGCCPRITNFVRRNRELVCLFGD